MKIAVGQIDPTVGAFEANVKRIKEAYGRACAEQARLLLTPELGICGYPLHDLMDRPEIFERCERALEELKAITRGQRCALAVGLVARNPSDVGRVGLNVVAVLDDGREVFRQAKTLLPTYDVFDEARYFEPAQKIELWECDGHRIAFAICEDLWGHDPSFGRKLYSSRPSEYYRDAGADLVVSISASPYEWGKLQRREELHRQVVAEVGAPLVYVNQVGATDEILFDGASFALDREGKLLGRLPVFSPAFGVVEVLGGLAPGFLQPDPKDREDHAPADLDILFRGLVSGIRDYFRKTGFKVAVVGLSGGIDSAVIATLAVQALGPKNLLCVAMPSQYSSGHSLEDAEALARNLGCAFEVRPIKFVFSTMLRELSERRGDLASLAQENLQSRLRGIILMTLSNHYNALVLTTGNKSELAMGYCTLYGDMAGALAPIGDLFKTRVYELARHMNLQLGNPIPERTLTKAPSAELRPGQTDQDSLPPYDQLDELLSLYIEKRASLAEIEAHSRSGGGEVSWIRDIVRKLEINEYERRQGAPVLKVSSKAFGIGRRIPLAKNWEQ